MILRDSEDLGIRRDCAGFWGIQMNSDDSDGFSGILRDSDDLDGF